MVRKRGVSTSNLCYCTGNGFWGWFFLILGVFFLAQALGWLSDSFPFWQILLVLFGIYLLSHTSNRN